MARPGTIKHRLPGPAAFALAACLAAAARAQTAGAPVPPAPVFLNHPSVIDTAHLKGGDTVVTLFGIQGWGGDPARGLQAFIAANGDRVTCQPHDGGTVTCMLPTGLDVAASALANGAARTAEGAPADYQQQQAAAQAAQTGLWAGTPPVPVSVQHPVVQTTSTLAAGGQTFVLDGVSGFSAQFYTLQLQDYIATHGDRLSCQLRPDGHYVCLLPDGSDLAAVALAGGLAKVGADANAQYRADQAQAVASRSGIWFDPPEQGSIAQVPLLTAVPSCCGVTPPDLGAGLAYADGVPTAVIEGQPVFFDYDNLLGFGFFDVRRRWHAAPEPFLARLNRAFPFGGALRHTASPPQPAASFRAPTFSGPGGEAGPLRADGRGPPIAAATSRIAGAFNRVAGGRSFAAPRLGAGSLTPLTPPRPVFAGLRSGISPYQPLGAPRPGFAGAGGFHPGLAVAPRFAAGRR